jgi:hypothetical protein
MGMRKAIALSGYSSSHTIIKIGINKLTGHHHTHPIPLFGYGRGSLMEGRVVHLIHIGRELPF